MGISLEEARKRNKEQRFKKWHPEEYQQKQYEKNQRLAAKENERKKIQKEKQEKNELISYLLKQEKMKKLEEKYQYDGDFRSDYYQRGNF